MTAEQFNHGILKRKTEELLQKFDRIAAALILVIIPLAAGDSHAVVSSAAVRVDVLVCRTDALHTLAAAFLVRHQVGGIRAV